MRRILTADGRPWRPDPTADVLLLGDSFTNIFSLEAMGWGTAAGLAEQLSFVLGRPVDRLVQNANGAFATREALARELARMNLQANIYTQWYWKINLHNLLHFLSLRVDPHAQWEIQVFAEIIAGMVKRVAPLSYEAWVDYDLVGQPMRSCPDSSSGASSRSPPGTGPRWTQTNSRKRGSRLEKSVS